MYAETCSGLNTHYKVQGDKHLPTLVFVPGTLGDKNSFDFVIEKLKNDYCCVSIDIIGRGESLPEGELSRELYSIDRHAEAVASVIHVLGVNDVYLVGHSLGAVISIRCANKYPDKVKGLVLVSPLLDSEETHYQNWNKAWSSTIDNIELMSQLAVGLVFSKDFLDNHPNTFHATKSRLQNMSNAEVTAFVFNLYNIRNFDILSEFNMLEMPILCVHGVNDIIHPVGDVEALVEQQPHANLCKISGAAHALNVEVPDIVAREILQFAN